MLIKDKDITSYQLLLTKQDRVLVLASLTSFFDYTVVNLDFFFFFFLLFEKNGSVGQWETRHFIGMALIWQPMFKKNRNMHSSFTWQRKHLFMLSREVEGELGGRWGGWVPYSRSFVTRIPHPELSLSLYPEHRFSGFFLFFFSIVNYEVITNGYWVIKTSLILTRPRSGWSK